MNLSACADGSTDTKAKKYTETLLTKDLRDRKSPTHKDTAMNETLPENQVFPGAVFSNWSLCSTRPNK